MRERCVELFSLDVAIDPVVISSSVKSPDPLAIFRYVA
jgi:hypothetical protein